MRFTETSLPGAYIIDLEKHSDQRGFFARSYCREDFAAHGIDFNCLQCNISFNTRPGILRGMHFQVSPKAEPKVVRCCRGALYDVIIDLRPEAETFCKWIGVELSADSYRMLYVPKGFAHGFLTLTDNTEVLYQMGEFYSPEHAGGVRWDDPAFGIQWPAEVRVISEKDRGYPDFGK